ncbi:unnamed protein product [Heligmosomoides polygyrus]|uniref:Uncharacterized protein n=1 Tax=Heligmosomoides polygyrus TaxID=6339 RepID=A0A183GFF5_HELPZ|nr:unnamed protein product [Heligmosomoides polygyrus]
MSSFLLTMESGTSKGTGHADEKSHKSHHSKRSPRSESREKSKEAKSEDRNTGSRSSSSPRHRRSRRDAEQSDSKKKIVTPAIRQRPISNRSDSVDASTQTDKQKQSVSFAVPEPKEEYGGPCKSSKNDSDSRKREVDGSQEANDTTQEDPVDGVGARPSPDVKAEVDHQDQEGSQGGVEENAAIGADIDGGCHSKGLSIWRDRDGRLRDELGRFAPESLARDQKD